MRRGDGLTLVDCMAKLVSDRDLSRGLEEAGRVKGEHKFRLDRLISESLSARRAEGWRDI